MLVSVIRKHAIIPYSRHIWSRALLPSILEMDNSQDNYDRRGWHPNRGHRGHRHYGSGQRRGQGYRMNDWGEKQDSEDHWNKPTKDSERDWRHKDFGNDARGSRPRGRAGGNRPPPGLKGREIGMWYARQSKEKTKLKDREERNEVTMPVEQKRHIERVLFDFKSDKAEQNTQKMAEATLLEDPWYAVRNISPSFSNNPKQGTSKVFENGEEETMSDNQTAKSTDGNDKVIYIDITEPSLTDIIKEWSEEDFMDEDTATNVLQNIQVPYRDENLNEELLAEFERKQDQAEYKKMMTCRKKLPSYKMRHDIVDVISKNQVVVLSGETGCGKTTQVPQYILDDYLERGEGSECHIICTQPRRISAISVSQRVADERAEKLGQSVGYMIRLENTMPRQRGSILFCTTGILLRKLESDPLMSSVTHIILDEIHERDLLSDFLIIILKDLLTQQPALKVILMSATLNASAFSEYFNNCPMISVPGFTYPVKEYFLEDVLEMLRYNLPDDMVKRNDWKSRMRMTEGKHEHEEKIDQWLSELHAEGRYSEMTLETLSKMDVNKIDLKLIRDLIRHIVTEKAEGAILVFVPGWGEISNLNKLLMEDGMFSSSSFRIIPLHSMMPTINQREVFDKPPKGVRKIVIATNIAETSITIDDIVYVIDSGQIKVKGFSPENNLMSLQSEIVSLANAKQRKGRAGRVQAGECYHLVTGLQKLLMLDYLPPEILRTPLEELCLQIKLLKLGKIIPFVGKAMQPPSLTTLQIAIQNLQHLNALDKDENLLPLGKHLARMPLDPHTGKMIMFAAMFGCLDPILTIAASLNFKDPFFVPLGKEKQADKAKSKLAEGCLSDHILLVKTFQKWLRAEEMRDYQFCHQYFLSKSTLQMLKKMRRQLEDILHEIGFLNSKNIAAANRNSENMSLVKSIVCAGLYPNIGKVRKLKTNRSNMKFTLKDESRCELHPKSVTNEVRKLNTQWMVYHQKMKTTAVFIYDCSLVNSYALLFFGGDIRESCDDAGNMVTVDDWIKFKATTDTVFLVKALRKELDEILEEKISKTDVSWNHGTKIGSLIETIIDLITTETGVQEDDITD